MRSMAYSYILISGRLINSYIVYPILLQHWAILLERELCYVYIPNQDLIEFIAKYSQLY